MTRQATLLRKPEPPAMADRRQRILAVAARRFAEAGFEQTTVRQIADDVEILSGSLYHHFATKEDMLHAIVRGAVERHGARATRIAALPGSAEARLVTLIRADLAALTHDHEAHAILYNERMFFRRNPDFAYVVEAKKQAYHAWQAIFEDGIAAREFASDIDLFLTISTIVRMLNTAADWFVHEDGAVLDSVVGREFERLAGFHLAFVLRAVRAVDRAAAPVPAALE